MNRDLGVIKHDGTALEIKIKELRGAEKHKRQWKIVCLTCSKPGLLREVKQPPTAAACE